MSANSPRLPVTNNALRESHLNATMLLVNAKTAKQDQDAFHLPLATTPAPKSQNSNSTNATGPLTHHHANKIQRVLPTRNNVNKAATKLHTVNATTKITPASHANQTPEIRTASKPWTSARLLKSKVDAKLKN